MNPRELEENGLVDLRLIVEIRHLVPKEEMIKIVDELHNLIRPRKPDILKALLECHDYNKAITVDINTDYYKHGIQFVVKAELIPKTTKK